MDSSLFAINTSPIMKVKLFFNGGVIMKIKDYMCILGLMVGVSVISYEFGKAEVRAIEDDIKIYKNAIDIYEIANKALSREIEELEKRGA